MLSRDVVCLCCVLVTRILYTTVFGAVGTCMLAGCGEYSWAHLNRPDKTPRPEVSHGEKLFSGVRFNKSLRYIGRWSVRLGRLSLDKLINPDHPRHLLIPLFLLQTFPQLAVETLLGLKNAQGSKGGGPMDEASAQAMAAVTAAAVSAAAAAAQEAAAHATAAGADNGTAASAAAAAAATAKAVAQAVAAAGALPPAEKPPTMGSRFDVPLVGEGKEPTTMTAASPVAAEKPPAVAANGTAGGGGGGNGAGGAAAETATEAKEVPAGSDEGKAATSGTAVAAAAAAREEGAQPASPMTWAPVHGGPEEAAPEAVAGRAPPAGPRLTPVANTVATDGKQHGAVAEQPQQVHQPQQQQPGVSVDVGGSGAAAAANQGRAVVSSV